MSSNNGRKGAGRASLQRKTTRGPLDVDDPLSDSASASASLPLSPNEYASSPLAASTELEAPLVSTTPLLPDPELPIMQAQSQSASSEKKDFSFLLDASIYHPLTSIDTPAPFRTPLPQLPPPNVSVDQILRDIEGLVAQCHFLAAAHLAGLVLTSGRVEGTDIRVIFRLLGVRYASLELCGNGVLAGQEAKALEDLGSAFYYTDENESTEGEARLVHVMPFDLRLMALRLQGIGFGDSRRTVGALFDLAMECREHLRVGLLDADTRTLWEDRIKEIGVRVVNCLIDMGDLDCAKRTLKSMRTEQENSDRVWTTRLVLLLIKMGEIHEARSLLDKDDIVDSEKLTPTSFLEIADGNYQKAVELLTQAVGQGADETIVTIAKQNLAVAYLYTGEIERSRKILESLVDEGHSFQALTVNLATLYDLKSDKSKDLKSNLVSKIAQTGSSRPQRGFINADFKL